MFDKIKFAQILKQISETYDNQREFSKKSEINRTYISQYINMKIDEPPKPKLLEKLANASYGITNYNELMNICGYTEASIMEEYLEDMYIYEDKKVLNSLTRIHLSKKEREVYDSLSNILSDDNILNINNDEFSSKINSYLDTIDWLNENSKNKIKNKLSLFKKYMQLPKKYAHKKSELINSDLDLYISPTYFMCPVYGSISAGQPNWAEECIEGRIPIDTNLMDIVNPEECFFLRVNGESMNKVVRNGAYALIRKTDWVENGEIAVVLVNGYDATLKKFTKNGDVVVLEPMSNDSSFQTQIYTKETPIKILGKYIGKFEMK